MSDVLSDWLGDTALYQLVMVRRSTKSLFLHAAGHSQSCLVLCSDSDGRAAGLVALEMHSIAPLLFFKEILLSLT